MVSGRHQEKRKKYKGYKRGEVELTVVTTSVTFISAYLHLKGHCKHSTSSEFSGGSNIVPHWGQNGHVVDDMATFPSPKLYVRRIESSVIVLVQSEKFNCQLDWLLADGDVRNVINRRGRERTGVGRGRGETTWMRIQCCTNEEDLWLLVLEATD